MTVLSQWYPPKGLYDGRDVEGIYILKDLPSLPNWGGNPLKLKPKRLVNGCVNEMAGLKARLLKHYLMGSEDRKALIERQSL